MEETYKVFNAFQKNIVDMGGKLGSGTVISSLTWKLGPGVIAGAVFGYYFPMASLFFGGSALDMAAGAEIADIEGPDMDSGDADTESINETDTCETKT